jgi:hypothetical protein
MKGLRAAMKGLKAAMKGLKDIKDTKDISGAAWFFVICVLYVL